MPRGLFIYLKSCLSIAIYLVQGRTVCLFRQAYKQIIPQKTSAWKK
jgi:hypothetical protein